MYDHINHIVVEYYILYHLCCSIISLALPTCFLKHAVIIIEDDISTELSNRRKEHAKYLI